MDDSLCSGVREIHSTRSARTTPTPEAAASLCVYISLRCAVQQFAGERTLRKRGRGARRDVGTLRSTAASSAPATRRVQRHLVLCVRTRLRLRGRTSAHTPAPAGKSRARRVRNVRGDGDALCDVGRRYRGWALTSASRHDRVRRVLLRASVPVPAPNVPRHRHHRPTSTIPHRRGASRISSPSDAASAVEAMKTLDAAPCGDLRVCGCCDGVRVNQRLSFASRS